MVDEEREDVAPVVGPVDCDRTARSVGRPAHRQVNIPFMRDVQVGPSVFWLSTPESPWWTESSDHISLTTGASRPASSSLASSSTIVGS